MGNTGLTKYRNLVKEIANAKTLLVWTGTPYSWVRLLKAPFSLTLNVSRDRVSTFSFKRKAAGRPARYILSGPSLNRDTFQSTRKALHLVSFTQCCYSCDSVQSPYAMQGNTVQRHWGAETSNLPPDLREACQWATLSLQVESTFQFNSALTLSWHASAFTSFHSFQGVQYCRQTYDQSWEQLISFKISSL